METYEKYIEKLTKEDLMKIIWEDEYFAICNMANLNYGFIVKETALGIFINKEWLRNIISSPGKFLDQFCNLSTENQQKIAWVLNSPELHEKLKLAKAKNKVSNNIDSELEKQIMKEYGITGRTI